MRRDLIFTSKRRRSTNMHKDATNYFWMNCRLAYYLLDASQPATHSSHVKLSANPTLAFLKKNENKKKKNQESDCRPNSINVNLGQINRCAVLNKSQRYGFYTRHNHNSYRRSHRVACVRTMNLNSHNIVDSHMIPLHLHSDRSQDTIDMKCPLKLSISFSITCSIRFYWFRAANRRTNVWLCGSGNIHSARSIEADGKIEWCVVLAYI